jgi:hypothetical protein
MNIDETPQRDWERFLADIDDWPSWIEGPTDTPDDQEDRRQIEGIPEAGIF